MIKFVATMQMSDFKAKCTKFNFGCGSAQTPLGELITLPRSPSWI